MTRAPHRTSTRSSAALGLCFLLSACGSGEVCSLDARAGLTVTVLTASGARVCDASVSASDADFSQVLTVLGDGASCTYSGAYERVGTYHLDVVSGLQSKAVDGLVVSKGSCHVEGLVITVTLDS